MKKRKKVLVGWAGLNWLKHFYYKPMAEIYFKQRVGILHIPFICNPCTEYTDGRSHSKIKVRITIEEIK